MYAKTVQKYNKNGVCANFYVKKCIIFAGFIFFLYFCRKFVFAVKRDWNYILHHLKPWVKNVLGGIGIILSAVVVAHLFPQNQAGQIEQTVAANVVEIVPEQQQEEVAPPEPEGHLVTYPGRSIRYSEKFRDGQLKHMKAAEKNGLQPPPANREEAARMHNRLMHIYTCKYYVVEDLTHSVPYLVPVAAKRLNAIGEEFSDILRRNGLPHYRFRVTSVLRTKDDIRRLRKSGNGNAVTNSVHNYGTTFDLAYTKFDKASITDDYMTDDNLKLVLGQVLLNHQRDGHIYVKYEYKQCCFHVTVRN